MISGSPGFSRTTGPKANEPVAPTQRRHRRCFSREEPTRSITAIRNACTMGETLFVQLSAIRHPTTTRSYVRGRYPRRGERKDSYPGREDLFRWCVMSGGEVSEGFAILLREISIIPIPTRALKPRQPIRPIARHSSRSGGVAEPRVRVALSPAERSGSLPFPHDSIRNSKFRERSQPCR